MRPRGLSIESLNGGHKLDRFGTHLLGKKMPHAIEYTAYPYFKSCPKSGEKGPDGTGGTDGNVLIKFC